MSSSWYADGQVEKLLEWGSQAGAEFHAGAVGPNGLTPLHLATLHKENEELSGSMVALLAGACPALANTHWLAAAS